MLGPGRQVDFVVVAHQHHAATFESVAQLLEGALDRIAVGLGRLLQLAHLQRSVGAEENRLERGRNVLAHAAGSFISTWIGPDLSFCRTRTAERRISSSTATKVTTASSLSSDSRMSSTSSIGPSRRRALMRSIFSCSVHVRPWTTSGRGGMRARTLLNAAKRTSTSSGSSWPPPSTGRDGGGNANDSCWARSRSSPAISL